MSAILENAGAASGRAIYSLAVDALGQISGALPTSRGEHFVLFLAWDARQASDDEILIAARELVRVGLAYIVAWGPDCERVHDLFDVADLEENPESNAPDTETVIISTWHDSEPLEEALWFAIHSAYPSPPYDATWQATILACVGDGEWGATIHRYATDLPSLDRAAGVSGDDG